MLGVYNETCVLVFRCCAKHSFISGTVCELSLAYLVILSQAFLLLL